MEMKRYQKEENFSPEKIAKLREHYKAILELLGEDPAREGLLKTPERVAKAMSFLTQGYEDDPLSIIRSATFKEEYRQMDSGFRDGRWEGQEGKQGAPGAVGKEVVFDEVVFHRLLE